MKYYSGILAVLVLSLAGSGSGRAQDGLAIDPGALDDQEVLRAPRRFVLRHSHSQGGGGSTPSVSLDPSVGGGVTIGDSAPEAEEHIAVDPSGGALVAAISDFSARGGYNTTKYAASITNGATWTTPAFVPSNGTTGALTTSDGNSWWANSDPVVAFGTSHTLYLANLYLINPAYSLNNNQAGGLYVSVGSVDPTTGSVTITSTNPVVPPQLNPNTTISEDKEWIAVDTSSSSNLGTVYCSWTHFDGNSDWINVSCSRDGGQTWAAPVQVSPSSQNGAVQGSQIAVDFLGNVYVVYEVFFIGGQRAQYFAKAPAPGSGSLVFSASKNITSTFKELTFSSSYRKSSFAALAVNPVTDAVYVSYSDQPSRSYTRVQLVMSTNGGDSWSSPRTLNDITSGLRLMPAIAVDELGGVHLSWFDTRNTGSASKYDIYAAHLKADGTPVTPKGVTPGNNLRVTSASISSGSSTFIGDYAGIAARGGSAHPVWTNGGFNGGRLQTASLTYTP